MVLSGKLTSVDGTLGNKKKTGSSSAGLKVCIDDGMNFIYARNEFMVFLRKDVYRSFHIMAMIELNSINYEHDTLILCLNAVCWNLNYSELSRCTEKKNYSYIQTNGEGKMEELYIKTMFLAVIRFINMMLLFYNCVCVSKINGVNCLCYRCTAWYVGRKEAMDFRNLSSYNTSTIDYGGMI